MGPRFTPARIPPPASVHNIPAHHASAHQPASHFNGYLDEARSRAATSPVATTPNPSPQDQAPQPGIDDKKPQDDDRPDGNDTQPHNPADLTPTLAAQTPVAPQDAVPVPATSIEGQTDQSPTQTQNPDGPSPNQPTPNPLPQETRTVAQDPNQSSAPLPQSAQTPTDTIQTAVAEQAPAPSAGDQPATPADKASRIASEQATATIEATKNRPQQPAKDAAFQTANKPAASPRPALPPPSDDPPPQATGPESSQPHRIGPPADARRQGLADDENTGSQREPTKSAPHPQIRGSTHLAFSARIRDGRGDAAAASIARFLLSSAAESSASATNATAAVSSANTSGLAATTGNGPAAAAPAAQAGLVADLLAAGAQDTDGIEGAARLLHASGKAGRFRATLQLDPPDLGQLRVQIQLHPQGLNLHVDVATHAVARLIESNLANLRDALALHGIQIDRAHVTVRAPAPTQADHQAAQDQGSASHGQPDRQSQGGHAGNDHPERRQIIDPHSVAEFDSGPYEKNVAAPRGFGADAIQQNRPTAELSVDLVA